MPTRPSRSVSFLDYLTLLSGRHRGREILTLGLINGRIGRSSCVGKNLALDELRFVAALLVLGFEVRMAEKQESERVIADMVDQFTAVPGQIELRFLQRADRGSMRAKECER